jgi:putative salt-induced outer membrane protein YdiY
MSLSILVAAPALFAASVHSPTWSAPAALAIQPAPGNLSSFVPVLIEDAAAAEAVEPQAPRWTGSLSIGASVSSGNTNKRSANANADAQLRRENDRFSLDGYWNYADQKPEGGGDRVLAERKLGASAKYDYFLSERTFLYAATSGAYDKIASLNLRWTAGAGVGYQFYEREDLDWALEAGLAYVNEDFVGSEDDNDYVSARGASDVRWDITEGVTFAQKAEVFQSLENSDDFLARKDSRVRLALTEAMFAQLQYVLEYNNSPATDKKRMDHLVALTVGWSF